MRVRGKLKIIKIIKAYGTTKLVADYLNQLHQSLALINSDKYYIGNESRNTFEFIFTMNTILFF